MPEAADANKSTRRYCSPRREEQARRTRGRIIAAAHESFLRSGYATTTIREVATDVETFLAIVGRVVRMVAERVAGLLLVLEEAARTDHEIAALARELDAQRATTATWIARGLAERTPLRDELNHDDAVDTIWLLMDPVVFRRLTRDRGWSADQFQHWFTDSIQRLLLRPRAAPRRRRRT